MKISYRWLKELLDFDASPDEVAHLLTMSGSEVEAIEEKGRDIRGVVSAKITGLKPHPGADRLTVCEVDTGRDRISVVCGAPNVRIGMNILFAGAGDVIAGNNKLKKSTIRGVESYGMILAEDELGISEDHTQVIELPADIVPGTPVEKIVELGDYIFELEITPNRPDCLSHIGIARELKALLGGEINYPPTSPDEKGPQAAADLTIEIADPEACPRYTGRLVSDVNVEASPLWLKTRLFYLGMRPINNVVDITNYVLLETGHPLHAFDYGYFKSKTVLIRRAKQGERFVTLDEVERKLNSKHLLITDGKEAVALAGIMGGLHSEVTAETTSVLLESAYFDPVTIRYGARAVGLSTESSQRFERGADPRMAPVANDRTCRFIAEICGGVVHKGIVDSCPKKFIPVNINFRFQRARDLLGAEIKDDEICHIFDGLDIEYKNGSPLVVTQPSFRPDLTREIDLIEEIARIYGLERIPAVYRPGGRLETQMPSRLKVKDRLRSFLVGRGFTEIFSSTLVDSVQINKIDGKSDLVKLQNPISEEMSALRPNLTCTMLKALKHNINHGNKDVKLFEIDTYYRQASKDLPLEKDSICLAISGRERPMSWRQKETYCDFYTLKAEIEVIFEHAKIAGLQLVPDEDSYFDSDCCYMIKSNAELLGQMGKVSTDAARIVGLKQDCFIAEMEFDKFCEFALHEKYFEPLAKYPSSDRDIALVVEQELPAERIMSLINKTASGMVVEVFPFDLYMGKNIPEGKKSIALRIVYRSKERTLTDDEVEEVHGRIAQRICDELGAELRS